MMISSTCVTCLLNYGCSLTSLQHFTLHKLMYVCVRVCVVSLGQTLPLSLTKDAISPSINLCVCVCVCFAWCPCWSLSSD